MNKQQIIEHLNRFNDDTEFILDLWTSDDIILEANELDYKLTPEDVETIVYRLQKLADQAMGIDWETVRFWIEEVGDNNTNLDQEDTLTNASN